MIDIQTVWALNLLPINILHENPSSASNLFLGSQNREVQAPNNQDRDTIKVGIAIKVFQKGAFMVF